MSLGASGDVKKEGDLRKIAPCRQQCGLEGEFVIIVSLPADIGYKNLHLCLTSRGLEELHSQRLEHPDWEGD